MRIAHRQALDRSPVVPVLGTQAAVLGLPCAFRVRACLLVLHEGSLTANAIRKATEASPVVKGSRFLVACSSILKDLTLILTFQAVLRMLLGSQLNSWD